MSAGGLRGVSGFVIGARVEEGWRGATVDGPVHRVGGHARKQQTPRGCAETVQVDLAGQRHTLHCGHAADLSR
jgi:hypothetical protein